MRAIFRFECNLRKWRMNKGKLRNIIENKEKLFNEEI